MNYTSKDRNEKGEINPRGGKLNIFLIIILVDIKFY
jgi:hypothetical protein